MSQWHEFTRRVCFHHSSGSKDHECLLIPSLSALRFHMLHSEYVLKIVFHACNSTLPPISACEYGWSMVNNQLQVVWDEEEVMDKVKSNKGCGCKGAKCDGSRAGCQNCYQMCRPCTMKCKCKLKCNNPIITVAHVRDAFLLNNQMIVTTTGIQTRKMMKCCPLLKDNVKILILIQKVIMMIIKNNNNNN